MARCRSSRARSTAPSRSGAPATAAPRRRRCRGAPRRSSSHSPSSSAWGSPRAPGPGGSGTCRTSWSARRRWRAGPSWSPPSRRAARSSSAARRAPVEQHTKLGDGERTLVQVTLPPSNHHVRLETIPSGAFAYVNGVLQTGQTPLELTVDDDDFYELAVEKDGFEMTTRPITPDDRDPVVTVTLLPEKTERGTLLLDSDIVAEVWVDGRSSGFISPTMFRLPAGDHTVQLRDDDDIRSATAKVKIKVGRATQLSLKGTRAP